MALWTRVAEMFERGGDAGGRLRNLRGVELRLAAAALLVHAAVIDGQFDSDEHWKLKTLLQSRFELSDGDARQLIKEAETREREAVDLYRFTSVLCAELDQDGRKRIIEMLWEIVLADGVVHEFEANLVWRVAELLGVSTRDRVILRKVAESRLSGTSSDGDVS